MKKGDIVTVVTMTGEYVGELAKTEPLTLKNPKMIVQAPNGGMGFAKGVAVTGKENPESMVISSYVFVSEVNENVAEAHRTAVSGIDVATPEETKIVTS
mgnify:CR=1 FL=1|jgi:hypothetical protein